MKHIFLFLPAFLLTLSSCSGDNEVTDEPETLEYILENYTLMYKENYLELYRTGEITYQVKYNKVAAGVMTYGQGSTSTHTYVGKWKFSNNTLSIVWDGNTSFPSVIKNMSYDGNKTITGSYGYSNTITLTKTSKHSQMYFAPVKTHVGPGVFTY